VENLDRATGAATVEKREPLEAADAAMVGYFANI